MSGVSLSPICLPCLFDARQQLRTGIASREGTPQNGSQYPTWVQHSPWKMSLGPNSSWLNGCMCTVQDKKAAKALRTEMKDADTNGDGMISFIEFLGYFQKMARYRADLARTQRLESYGRPRDLPPSTVLPPLSSSSSCSLCRSYDRVDDLSLHSWLTAALRALCQVALFADVANSDLRLSRGCCHSAS